MDESINKHLKHNYIVNILDGGFFGLGLGFASFSTIVPLFVSTMTDSAILIGLIPAIHNMGWQLPQLFTAKKISQLSFLKRHVLLMTIHERLPFFFLIFISWFLPSIGVKTGLILTFLCLIWQGIGGGITANGWQNFIGKIIPSDYRATFFGIQSGASNLLASGGAIIAGLILESVPGNRGFSYCFSITCVCFIISWFALNFSKEPHREVVNAMEDSHSLLLSIKTILRKDVNFCWYLGARILYQFGIMAPAFYTVYAVRQHGMSDTQAGIMTSILFIAQVSANPTMGWLADRWSKKGVLIIGSVAALFSAGLAAIAPNLSWFVVIFILAGIANTIFWTIGLAFSLEFGTEEERPTYVGLANTLIAPSAILAPLLGGLLADNFSYPTTFFTSAVFSLISALFIIAFVKNPSSARPA